MYGRHKYHAKKTTITLDDGTEMTFDSKKEAQRYNALCLRQEAGEISNLQMQVRFTIIPEHREPDTVGKRGGIIKGKVIERPCYYVADFVYRENGKMVVEDVKGCRDSSAYALYSIKRKLMLDVYGIRIKEV